jgi:hypothetical protein
MSFCHVAALFGYLWSLVERMRKRRKMQQGGKSESYLISLTRWLRAGTRDEILWNPQRPFVRICNLGEKKRNDINPSHAGKTAFTILQRNIPTHASLSLWKKFFHYDRNFRPINHQLFQQIQQLLSHFSSWVSSSFQPSSVAFLCSKLNFILRNHYLQYYCKP